MRVSRAPERRSGTNKSMMLFLLVIAALLVGILVTYVTTGFGSSSAKGDQGEVAAAETAPPIINSNLAALPTLATRVPTAVPTPAPAVSEIVAEVETSPFPNFVPDVVFGEVLSEGFVEIDLPSQEGVTTWYTFQVDTTSREMTLFFAIYNETQDALVRSIKVEGYTQGQILNNAEIAVFYPSAPERILGFDGEQGIMTIAQQNGKPLGPSLFSPELRVALVNYGITLQDASGNIQTQLHLDISGLSETEGIVLSRYSPDLVASVLNEVQLLVDQVESRRSK